MSKFQKRDFTGTIKGYTNIKFLDEGGFGKIYKAFDPFNNPVALKEFRTTEESNHEWKVLKALQSIEGIPKVYNQIQMPNNKAIISMQLLGPNLLKHSYLTKEHNYKQLYEIWENSLKILQKVHKKNFVHNDIKPNQFLYSTDMSQLFLVDFGLAKKFRDKNRHKILEPQVKREGNLMFATLNCHKGYNLSRRDDIISFAYMLIYLAKGKLPWEKIPNAYGKIDKWKYVKVLKASILNHELCQGLPIEFLRLLEYAKSLMFEQKPNYEYLISLAHDAKQKILNFSFETPKARLAKHKEKDSLSSMKTVEGDLPTLRLKRYKLSI